jgi:hypothetical protein
MTREETIKHWAEDIVPAVFKAEDKLRPKLKALLKDESIPSDERVERYKRMIAEDIVNQVPDSYFEQENEEE